MNAEALYDGMQTLTRGVGSIVSADCCLVAKGVVPSMEKVDLGQRLC